VQQSIDAREQVIIRVRFGDEVVRAAFQAANDVVAASVKAVSNITGTAFNPCLVLTALQKA
jgi:hypothetical protein